ncbi:MAG: coenzyme F420-0:L-glutamate ligase [Anaerolineaceae bacterium]|nr:coenzyme F420-0:L-glutamate ligase [Anaerolineaceae bacterium]
MELKFTSLDNIPLIKPGDDLSTIIAERVVEQGISPQKGDIFILAQKIVSKAEGRLVNLSTIQPSPEAIRISEITQKDPRFVEVVLSESKKVLRVRFNTLIVEHKRGFICANAGIDHSNVRGEWGEEQDWILLLPEDADASAESIRQALQKRFGVDLGVIIIDSHGRAWRNGTVGIAIGLAGMPGLVDLRGNEDLFGFKLKVTQVGAADELAAGASLLMGQAKEGTPVVMAHGFPYALREGNLQELIRPEEMDLFR